MTGCLILVAFDFTESVCWIVFWELSLSLNSILLTYIWPVHSCSLLCNIPLYDYTTICPVPYKLLCSSPGGQVHSPPVTSPVNSSCLSGPKLTLHLSGMTTVWAPLSCTMFGRQTWWTWGSPAVLPFSQVSQLALPVIQLLKTVAPYILSSFIVSCLGQEYTSNTHYYVWADMEVCWSLFFTESFGFALCI